MSGGSMDYLYFKVEDANFKDDTPHRLAFRKHLKKVALALKAIEWNDSGDGDDGEEQFINACISKADLLNCAVERAENTLSELQRVIKEVKK